MVIGLGDGGTAGDKIYVNFILFRRFTSSTLSSHGRHEDIQGVRTKKRCLVKCFKLDLSYLQSDVWRVKSFNIGGNRAGKGQICVLILLYF